MASIMKKMMMRGAGIALMLLMATTAWAEDYLTGVDYMTWSDSEKKLVPAKTPEDVKVYILDGTEETLGTAGTKEAPTEAWYIAKGNLSYDHQLAGAKYCDIHLILEDRCNMCVGTEESPITGNHAIYIKSANLTIYGQSTGDNMGRLTAISNNKDGIFIQSDPAFGVFLTINGGQVTAKGGWAIDAEITQNYNPLTGGITINGGKVTANGAERGICASANHSSAKAILTINGGEVYTTNSSKEEPCIGGTEVTITGGHVEAKNNDINGMAISGSEITITGGQVEAIGGSNGCGIFNWINDITLGWTDNSDYIKASSYGVLSGSVKTAAGKRFVAYDPVGEGETELAASGIIGDATTAVTITDLSTIDGKTLRPFDGYRLQVEAKGITPSGYNREFTLTTGEGENTVTTHYYVYKADDDVTLTLPSLGQSGVLLGTRAAGGTDDAYAYLDVTTTDNVATAKLPMSTGDLAASDFTIKSARYYATGVKYLDWDNSKKKLVEATTPEGTKVWILDGTETTLGTAGTASAPTEAWYIAKGNLSYDHQLKSADYCAIHLILADDCNMTVGTKDNPIGGDAAIYVYRAGLTIYGQSTGDDMGTLTAIGGSNGIYAVTGVDPANITINGGQVTAIGTGTDGRGILATATINSNATITINGGQVTATGGIGGYGIYANSVYASITLGWTAPTDFINASSYGVKNGSVQIAAGKYFLIDGTETILGNADEYIFGAEGNATLDDIAGKKLLPIVGIATGGVKYFAFTDNDGNRKLVGDDVQVYVVTGYDLAKGKAYLKAVEGNVIPKGLPVVIGSKTEDDDLPANIFILGGDDSQTTVEGLLKNFVSCNGTQTVQAYLDALFGEGASLSEYIPYLLTGGTFKSVDVKATDVIKKDVCLLFIPKWDVLMGKSAGTTNAGTRSIGIGNGEATSITTVPSPTGEGCAWYDLQGRKLSGKPTRKGVYIRNGRVQILP